MHLVLWIKCCGHLKIAVPEETIPPHSGTDSPILHRKTLQLSRQLRDQAVEAQACYSLGNTYTLLQDYERAAEYHLRHLVIAQELADRCVRTRPWLGLAFSDSGGMSTCFPCRPQHGQSSLPPGPSAHPSVGNNLSK